MITTCCNIMTAGAAVACIGIIGGATELLPGSYPLHVTTMGLGAAYVGAVLLWLRIITLRGK